MRRTALILPLLLMASCGSVKQLPIETKIMGTDYRDRAVYLTDSIHLIDSITVHKNGDTVYVERWRNRWRERTVKDTIVRYVETRDSVSVRYPIEKRLTCWQKFKMEAGGLAIAVLAAAAAILITKIARTLI